MDELIEGVEDIIDEMMENLKPELREKVVWRFSDEIKKENENSIVRADINQNFHPALITFYSTAIVNGYREDCMNLIGHEIGHLFSKNEESASRLENKRKIFNDEQIQNY